MVTLSLVVDAKSRGRGPGFSCRNVFTSRSRTYRQITISKTTFLLTTEQRKVCLQMNYHLLLKGKKSSIASLSPSPLLQRLNFLRRVGGAASCFTHDDIDILPTAHKSVTGPFRFSNIHKYSFGSYQGKEMILCQKKMLDKC